MLKNIKPLELISSDRIYLKKHSKENAKVMFLSIDKDRKRLKEFLHWLDYIKSVEDELKYIIKCKQDWINCTVFDYGIYLKDGDIYLGNIGAHKIELGSYSCEIGYWILGEHEGKGYVTEAVKLLDLHLFDLGFKRVQICCSDINSRSAKIPERAKYTFEGVLRQNALENGKFRNTKVFSKLKSDLTL